MRPTPLVADFPVLEQRRKSVDESRAVRNCTARLGVHRPEQGAFGIESLPVHLLVVVSGLRQAKRYFYVTLLVQCLPAPTCLQRSS